MATKRKYHKAKRPPKLQKEPQLVRTFKYGLVVPRALDRDLVDRLYPYHRLQNDAVTMHREEVVERRAYDSTTYPELKTLWDQLQVEWDAQRKNRREINDLRGTSPATEEAKQGHQDLIDTLKEEGQAIEEKIKALWKKKALFYTKLFKTDTAYKAWITAHQEKWHEKRLDHRATRVEEDNLYWGSYNVVWTAADQTAKTCKGLPRRSRWEGEGSLQVQIQKAADQVPSKLFGTGHTLVQIDPVDPRAWDPSVPKGERRRLQRTRLRLRVGSDERKPVFVEVPMIMHRPIPADARVATVTITRRRHANGARWAATFVLNRPLPVVPPDEDALQGKRVGLDYSWRQRADGALRVAYWADSDGNHGEFLLPAAIRQGQDHAGNIQGIRDQLRDALRGRLLEDLKDRSALPQDLREEVEHLAQWRASQKFARLWFRHRDQIRPFLSDKGLAEPFRQDWEALTDTEKSRRTLWSNYFEAWVHRDRHLWQYEVGTRKRAIGARNDLYANIAAKLVTKYDLVALEDLKVANLSKLPQPETKADVASTVAHMNKVSRRQRTEVAPGHLEKAILQAAEKLGKRVVMVPAPNTSKTCHLCGHVQRRKLGPSQYQTCETCRGSWDRDYNAAQNIRLAGERLLRDPGTDQVVTTAA
jgi:predicted Zn-ribbon and HTH transcriptional regulator